jgi:hypothetical protein
LGKKIGKSFQRRPFLQKGPPAHTFAVSVRSARSRGASRRTGDGNILNHFRFILSSRQDSSAASVGQPRPSPAQKGVYRVRHVRRSFNSEASLPALRAPSAKPLRTKLLARTIKHRATSLSRTSTPRFMPVTIPPKDMTPAGAAMTFPDQYPGAESSLEVLLGCGRA